MASSESQNLDKDYETVKTLVETIERNFKGFNISEIIKGGSLGHGTPVFLNHDVDLVVYSLDISEDDIQYRGYQKWLDQLDRFLSQFFRNKYQRTRMTARSVQFTYEGIDVDLLVSPCWKEDQHKLYRFLKSVPAHQRNSFTVCASKWQVKFFKDQPPQVKEYIRKAKEWRNEKWPEGSSGSGRPSSYLMSLLVVAAYERNPRNVTQAIKDLVKSPMIDLCWTRFYKKSDYPLPSRPRVVDPANPFNDVWQSGFKSYARGEKPRDYEPGDGNSTVLKRCIDTINLN